MKKWTNAAFLAAGILFLTGMAIDVETEKSIVAGYDFILQAHRGLSDRYPENTIVSFSAAAEREEYQGIETDVQETADGVLVLYHDSDISKKTDATGSICDYDYEEIQKIHIINAKNSDKYPNEQMPTLEAFLEICDASGKIPYIELKSLTEDGVRLLIERLDAGGWQNRCVITSFDRSLIGIFRSINSKRQILRPSLKSAPPISGAYCSSQPGAFPTTA